MHWNNPVLVYKDVPCITNSKGQIVTQEVSHQTTYHDGLLLLPVSPIGYQGARWTPSRNIKITFMHNTNSLKSLEKWKLLWSCTACLTTCPAVCQRFGQAMPGPYCMHWISAHLWKMKISARVSRLIWNIACSAFINRFWSGYEYSRVAWVPSYLPIPSTCLSLCPKCWIFSARVMAFDQYVMPDFLGAQAMYPRHTQRVWPGRYSATLDTGKWRVVWKPWTYHWKQDVSVW